MSEVIVQPYSLGYFIKNQGKLFVFPLLQSCLRYAQMIGYIVSLFFFLHTTLIMQTPLKAYINMNIYDACHVYSVCVLD